jgi:hypothetical protein
LQLLLSTAIYQKTPQSQIISIATKGMHRIGNSSVFAGWISVATLSTPIYQKSPQNPNHFSCMDPPTFIEQLPTPSSQILAVLH